MPRSRKVENKKRATRTIRVYETQAILIDQLARRSAKNRTVADVIEDWAQRLYPAANEAIKQTTGTIDEAINADEDEPERRCRMIA